MRESNPLPHATGRLLSGRVDRVLEVEGMYSVLRDGLIIERGRFDLHLFDLQTRRAHKLSGTAARVVEDWCRGMTVEQTRQRYSSKLVEAAKAELRVKGLCVTKS